MTSTINKKILIHYSSGGQKNKNKNKEVLITSLAEFRINIYNFIKKINISYYLPKNAFSHSKDFWVGAIWPLK